MTENIQEQTIPLTEELEVLANGYCSEKGCGKPSRHTIELTVDFTDNVNGSLQPKPEEGIQRIYYLCCEHFNDKLTDMKNQGIANLDGMFCKGAESHKEEPVFNKTEYGQDDTSMVNWFNTQLRLEEEAKKQQERDDNYGLDANAGYE